MSESNGGTKSHNVHKTSCGPIETKHFLISARLCTGCCQYFLGEHLTKFLSSVGKNENRCGTLSNSEKVKKRKDRMGKVKVIFFK